MTPLSTRLLKLFTTASPVRFVEELAHILEVTVREAQSALHNDLRFRRVAFRDGHPGFAWTTNELYFGIVPKKDHRRHDRPRERPRDDYPPAAAPSPALEPKPKKISKPRTRSPRGTHRAVQWLIDHPGEHALSDLSTTLSMNIPALRVMLKRHQLVTMRLVEHPHHANSARLMFSAKAHA